jgi:sulfur-oxidizing protein SoxY
VSMKRRTFLKGSLMTSALGVAVGAGMLKPKTVLAAWPEAAFKADSMDAAMSAIGATGAAESDKIKFVKTPEIAENGNVVPINIETSIPGVESISVMVENNPSPLACQYLLTSNCDGYVAARIKMRKTSDVTAIVKAGGKSYMAKKQIKVTIGGCGG